MLCNSCQTTLPDEAIACWKCGTSIKRLPAPVPVPVVQAKDETELLLAILTFFLNGAFFICAGWTVPFTLWGTIVSTGRDHPEMTNLIDMIGGVILVIAAVLFFTATWWGSYQVIRRLLKSSGPAPASGQVPAKQ